MKKIIKDEKMLRTVSSDVEDVEEAKNIISELKRSLIPHPHGIGLGAIQIGIPKRIAVFKHKGSFFSLINPEIIEKKESFHFMKEGCLSIPNKSFTTERYRHIQVKTNYIDGDELKEQVLYFYYGHRGEINNDDLTAIAVQHEIDHMNGILISDYNIKNTQEQYIRVDSKVGRNDPCPCGSGKKYKKCCL